jgi:hypothetical protein
MLLRENGGRDASPEAVTSGQFSGASSRHFLLNSQNPDGGWGYHPAAPSSAEATSWALLALLSRAADPALADACVGARAWLRRAQMPDGSWPAIPGQRQGCWVTSLAALALHLEGSTPDAVVRGRDWLLDAWPADSNFWWRLRRVLARGTVVRQDNSLHGWSWTPGTASWVEPTAHALLFLRSLPAELLPPRAAKRRQLGERMLYDRMCPGGGWNSGNPQVYGVAGMPRIGPTAWALLALLPHSQRAENQMSLDWLEAAYPRIRGAASLALAHRCLQAYGRPVAPLTPGVGDLYLPNQFFKSVLTFAWIAWAESGEENRSSQTGGDKATA